MHVTLNFRTNFRSDGARLRIDAGLPNGFRLQSLAYRSNLMNLRPGTTAGSHPMGPKLWNL